MITYLLDTLVNSIKTSLINKLGLDPSTEVDLDDFPELIDDIPIIPNIEELTVTTNGTYTAPTDGAYTPVIVDLPLGTKTVTTNGTYDASDDDLEGYTGVTVDIEGCVIVDDTTPESLKTLTTAPYPMAACKVGIEAQQDLNGYDHPWVGGTNVNKFPNALSGTQTSNGITVVSDGKGTYTISGTAEADAEITFDLITSYTAPTSSGYGGTGVLYLFNTFTAPQEKCQVGFSDGTTEDMWNVTPMYRVVFGYVVLLRITITKFKIKVYSGATISGSVSPMFVDNSSRTETWSPYSNICPITGWDSIETNVTAVNMWDEEWRNGYYDGNTGVFYSNNSYVANKNPILVKSGMNPYVNVPSGKGWCVFYYDKDMNFIRRSTLYLTAPATITIPENCHYINFYCNTNYGSTYNNDISINYPSTDTSYHAYNGTTYTESLATTNYGGYWDAVDGEIGGENGYVDLGTLTWAYDSAYSRFMAKLNGMENANARTLELMCSQYEPISDGRALPNVPDGGIYNGAYANSTGIYIHDSRYTDAADFTTAISGVQLVYPLATPITTSTTPRVINTNDGATNVWANSGKIERAKYLTPLS